MAPVDPGGGWHTTAREMARIMESAALIPKNVEVYNVSCAGSAWPSPPPSARGRATR